MGKTIQIGGKTEWNFIQLGQMARIDSKTRQILGKTTQIGVKPPKNDDKLH